MPTDLTIGQFAQLAHLSVKTLHHYHDVGVLIPARIDDRSGYRYYSRTQAPTAHLIRRLRELDMPLDEVQTLLETDPATREQVVGRHLDRMSRELARTTQIVQSLQRMLSEGQTAALSVEQRHLPDITALVSRHHLHAADAAAWVEGQLRRLEEVAASTDILVTGPSTALFAATFFEEDEGPLTVLLPVDPTTDPPQEEDVTVEEIPGGEFLIALHHGPYADLDHTYGRLGGYAHDHGLAGIGPIRERYVVDPGDADTESDLMTEVCWPVA